MSGSENLVLEDVSKMKVADLKRELKARGLSTTGNKLELMERLQNGNADLLLDDNGTVVEETDIIDEDAMLEDGLDDEDDDDEDDDDDGGGGVGVGVEEEDEVLTPDAEKVLYNEPKITKSSQKRKLNTIEKSSNEIPGQAKKIVLNRNSVVSSEKENQRSVSSQDDDISGSTKQESNDEKKLVKLSNISMQQRLQLRAQKFGSSDTEKPKTEEMSKKEARAIRFGITSQAGLSVPVTVTADKLKMRAERFGQNVSSIAMKVELAEKLKARKERFGVQPNDSSSLLDKKKLRAERFQLN